MRPVSCMVDAICSDVVVSVQGLKKYSLQSGAFLPVTVRAGRWHALTNASSCGSVCVAKTETCVALTLEVNGLDGRYQWSQRDKREKQTSCRHGPDAPQD
jgi:hypothetical protein